MPIDKLGYGTATSYEVLCLENGMTIAELQTRLSEVSVTGKLVIGALSPERISESCVRLPIEIKGGTLKTGGR